MKKVLILVLSADYYPYSGLMETQMNTWDSIEVEEMKTIFYCGMSSKPNTDKIIYLPVEEKLLNLGHKALLAFQWALLNKEFDYIARVHSSMYVDKVRLREYVDNLPEGDLFAGVEAESQNGFQYLWGGVGFLLSHSVVQKIVNNKNLWRHEIMEDESMSCLVSSLGIPFSEGYSGAIDDMGADYRCISYTGQSISFTDFGDLIPLKHHYFRCKCDGNREGDKLVMNNLFISL